MTLTSRNLKIYVAKVVRLHSILSLSAEEDRKRNTQKTQTNELVKKGEPHRRMEGQTAAYICRKKSLEERRSRFISND